MGRVSGIEPAFLQWLAEQGKEIISQCSTAGGCVADSRKLVLNDGAQLFIKQLADPTPGLFSAEASGLAALSEGGAVRTPDVVYQNERCLVLEYIEAATRISSFDEHLGRQLASLHSIRRDFFGFERDTFCGTTRQPNLRSDNGYEFYAQQRFNYLARLCYDKGYLSPQDLSAVENICRKLPELIPQQTPVLLHGDLWSGNVHTDSDGKPVLIDPAVYYGWAEADLAMTALFGGFSSYFYAAYQEVRPLDSGWERRLEFYNLWHLLNHLHLFGESYLSDVKQVIKKYA